jgi:putative pyruvate formate lyase activating enzyme
MFDASRDVLERGGKALPDQVVAPSRSIIARQRAKIARDSLASCALCVHDCRVNRLVGEHGRCQAGSQARIFSAQMEVSDELELAPVFAIAFSGCDLRCDFCITGAESWNPSAGESWPLSSIADSAQVALDRGARTIMFLGGEPTIHLPTVLEIVGHMPDDAVLAWKTNAHGSEKARALLDGIFDVWVADYKFGNDRCARRLAKVGDYTRVVRENLTWACARTDLIVRHLLMPGHLECCWRPVAEWLSAELPLVKVNLRSGYWPAWRANRHPELSQPGYDTTPWAALDIAQGLGLRLVD